MRSSNVLRRLGAALSMAFLLDLGGQTSATLCAASAVATRDGAMAHEPGMSQPGGARSVLSVLGSARDGCQIPANARDCATMTTCAWPAAIVASPLTAPSFAAPSFAPAEPVPLLPGPTAAPEPPPPRG